jgi:hypothetical protein
MYLASKWKSFAQDIFGVKKVWIFFTVHTFIYCCVGDFYDELKLILKFYVMFERGS